MSTAKDDLTRLIQEQPEDSSPEEIVRELAFHVMIERGVSDSDARRVVSNEDMAKRIGAWSEEAGPKIRFDGSRISSSTLRRRTRRRRSKSFRGSTSVLNGCRSFHIWATGTTDLSAKFAFCCTGITALPTWSSRTVT